MKEVQKACGDAKLFKAKNGVFFVDSRGNRRQSAF
jgi:hypothetical protein